MTKNCELRIKHFLDEDDETFEYIGDPYVINLEHYIGKQDFKKEMYFTPKDKNSDVSMIKVVAKITVRPSVNKPTSSEKYANHKFQGEDANTKHFNHNHALEKKKTLEKHLSSKDPESTAVWNHPIYKHNVQRNLKHKDHAMIDDVLVQKKCQLAEEIGFILEQKEELDKFFREKGFDKTDELTREQFIDLTLGIKVPIYIMLI